MSTFHARVDAAQFHEALGNVLRFSAKRSSLPILAEANVCLQNGRCVLTCTNLNQWCIAAIPASGDSFSFVFAGTQKIFTACKYFSGELELTYTVEPTKTNPDPSGQISISDGKRSLARSTERSSDFPELMEKPNLLERYLPEVPKVEVLAQLSDQTRALLEAQEFLSAEAYSKQLREQVADMEKDMVYIQGQIDLHTSQQKEQAQELMEVQVRHTQLQERIDELECKRTTGFNGNSLNDRLADLYARYEELQREAPEIANTENLDAQIQAAAEKLACRKADTYQSKYAAALAQAQERIQRLSMEFKRIKHIYDGLKAGVQCPMCRQTITEQTLPQVKTEFAASLRRIQAEGCQLTAQFKEVQELDAKARAVFEQYREDDIRRCFSSDGL